MVVDQEGRINFKLKAGEKDGKTVVEQELKRSKLEAEAVRVRADADAYAKRANASANKSLDAKLNAWVEANKAWADSSAAPPVVFNGAPGAAKGGRKISTSC